MTFPEVWFYISPHLHTWTNLKQFHTWLPSLHLQYVRRAVYVTVRHVSTLIYTRHVFSYLTVYSTRTAANMPFVRVTCTATPTSPPCLFALYT